MAAKSVVSMELSKYFNVRCENVLRSQVRFAEYNPRELNEEEKKQLKRGIKRFGLLGGLVLNEKEDGYVVVQGHQRITCMDELEKYNPETKENDYTIRAEILKVDEKAEKEINILLNNPNAQGRWDYDKLAQLITDIDYKNAGLTEADLNMIGVDFLLQTEEENNLSSALDEMMQPLEEHRQQQKAEIEAARDSSQAEQEIGGEIDRQALEESEREARTEHMKEVKAGVREKAINEAMDMDAYFMISFDTWEAKANFMRSLGYDPMQKVIKGEVFAEQILS